MLALCLVICYLSSQINPARFWVPALIELAYPFFLIANLLFMIYWAIRWRREFFISLITIVLGINHFNAYVQLPCGKKDNDKNTQIKLLTYNVNMFGLQQWQAQNPVYQDIIEYIKANGHNIVCFQEFFTRAGTFSLPDLQRELGMEASAKFVVSTTQTGYGLATLSKFPIVGSGVVEFQNTYNACIYSDLKIGDDTVRIYNAHLQSTRFKDRNLKFLQGAETHSRSETYDEIWDIVRRLRKAFRKRAAQVDSIASHAARCGYHTIICGDFNDSPISYTYRQLRKNRADAFIEAGVGIANTYPKLRATYRIDYVLYSKQLKASKYECPKLHFSDHYPVSVGMDFKYNTKDKK